MVYAEEKDTTLLSMEYVVHGVLLAPVQPKRSSLHYLVDTVDADIFL